MRGGARTTPQPAGGESGTRGAPAWAPLPASPVAWLARPGRAQLPGVGRDQRAESRPPPSPTETGIRGPRGRNPQPHSGCPGRHKARVGQGCDARIGTTERGNNACANSQVGGHPLPGPGSGLYPLGPPSRAPAGPRRSPHCREGGPSGGWGPSVCRWQRGLLSLTSLGETQPGPHRALRRPRGREGISGGRPWQASPGATGSRHTHTCTHTYTLSLRQLALWQGAASPVLAAAPRLPGASVPLAGAGPPGPGDPEPAEPAGPLRWRRRSESPSWARPFPPPTPPIHGGGAQAQRARRPSQSHSKVEATQQIRGGPGETWKARTCALSGRCPPCRQAGRDHEQRTPGAQKRGPKPGSSAPTPIPAPARP